MANGESEKTKPRTTNIDIELSTPLVVKALAAASTSSSFGPTFAWIVSDQRAEAERISFAEYQVKLLLHTQFVDVQTKGNSVTEAVICGHSGPEALKAKVFIDCSGGGFVAKQAGFECFEGRDGDKLQLPASIMYFVREFNETISPQIPEGWFASFAKKEDLPMTSIWPNGPGSKALKVKVPFGSSAS